MFDISKYRTYDYFTIRGLIADVETENDQGELINYICSKDCSWIKKTYTITENFNYTATVLEYLNSCSDFELTVSDLIVCGDTIQFCNQENGDGYTDARGEYFVNYVLDIQINGISVNEEDLYELFPEFCW
jgi:hypothetical protein